MIRFTDQLFNFNHLAVDDAELEPKRPKRGCAENQLALASMRLSFGETEISLLRHKKTPSDSIPIFAQRQRGDEYEMLTKYDKLTLEQLFRKECSLSGDAKTDTASASDKKNVILSPNFRIRTGGVSAERDEEEFLLIQGKTVIRGKGLNADYQILCETYVVEKPVVDAVWCTFRHHDRHVKPQHATLTPRLESFSAVETVCLAQQRKLIIHRDNGERYAFNCGFPIRKLWSCPLGLLVERDPKIASDLTDITGYPRLFSLTCHLDEPAPILFLGGDTDQSASLLLHPECEIVGTVDDLPLILIFDPSKNTHSLWFARLSTAEDIEQASETLRKQALNGKGLHFHRTSDSKHPRRLSSTLPDGTTSSIATKSPISPATALANGGPQSFKKPFDLYKKALVTSSEKFSPKTTEVGPLNLMTPGSGPSGSMTGIRDRAPFTIGPLATDMLSSITSATKTCSEMSISTSKSSFCFPTSPVGSHTDHLNVPAQELMDLRSPVASLAQSKIMSMLSNTSIPGEHTSGSLTRKHKPAVSQHSYLRKPPRLSHPTRTVTDELAYPKVAMVHIWSDASEGIRQSLGKDVFLLANCGNEYYFCYILPSHKVLRCIRLIKEDDVQHLQLRLTVDTESSIPALSAVRIGCSELMVVLDPSQQLVVYSTPDNQIYRVDCRFGAAAAGKMLLPLVTFEPPVASSPVLAGTTTTVLSPSFSPVPHLGETPPILSTKSATVTRLMPTGGNKFVMITDNEFKVCRVVSNLTTDLINRCCAVLRLILPRDIFSKMKAGMEKSVLQMENFRQVAGRWDGFFISILRSVGCIVKVATLPDIAVHQSDWELLSSSAFAKVKLPKQHASALNTATEAEITIVAQRNNRVLKKVLLCLHLVYDESRLCCLWSCERQCMVSWLLLLAKLLELPRYVEFYQALLNTDQEKSGSVKVELVGNAVSEKILPDNPPDLFASLEGMLRKRPQKYPIMQGVNPIAKDIVLLVSNMSSHTKDASDRIVQILERNYLSSEMFSLLPHSLRTALQHRFAQMCEEVPFELTPDRLFEMARREDALLCRQAVTGKGLRDFCVSEVQRKVLSKSDSHDAFRKRTTPLPHNLITKRFAGDARLREAEKLLTTSEPVIVPLNAMHSANEVDFRTAQQTWLKSLLPRILSLPVARGMLCLRTEYAYATEKLSAPEMVFSGVERGTGRKISLKPEEFTTGYDFWPRFHNGVATGLRLRCYDQDAIRFDHHWLAFNAAQYTKRESVDYAGIFLGMALNGAVDIRTDPMDLHNMLVRLEDSVSIAVILGMACVNRGTQDKRYFRMISLHIVSLIEDPNVELLIPQNIYVASLLSLGLLYKASANRFISERLLEEIWTGPPPETDGVSQPASSERESASLAAAAGLGFVLLGLGNESALGLADLEIPQRLRTYMIGGLHGKCSTQFKRPEVYQSSTFSTQRREDEQSINIHITAPGAILALAMIYLKTERRDIADWMAMPQTLQELDEIRPDFLLLRIVARSLIMWESVENSEKWISSNFPPWILKNVFLSTTDMEAQGLDVVSITQAYFFILAGSCMSLGLKYAGTASEKTKTIFMTTALMMIKWSEDNNLARQCSQSLMQTCLTTIVVALASVMAGTGDLEVFRLLRYLHGRSGGPRSPITYGHQMGVHMAIGLLFLGCGMYTLGTSNEAIAAMLLAFYPMWPKNQSDNRYHLQAFRHLYVLAVENRLMMTRSVYGGQPVEVAVRVEMKDSSKNIVSMKNLLMTPCVLPEISSLRSVSVASGDSWLTFTGKDNWVQMKKLLNNGGLAVYPPSGLRKNHDVRLFLMNFNGGVLNQIDRLMSRPANGHQTMKKLLQQQHLYFSDLGLAGLFEIASRNLMGNSATNLTDDQWIAWILYECAGYGQTDAFMEIMTFSKETDTTLQQIAARILSENSTENDEKNGKWKTRLQKRNFLHILSGNADAV
ncbi:LOW QUALITY PROTEIN: anaphase-promoting complex subunit 1-like [Paramacrobiotus metropolitanus]|uniref:LOW QUALITY PROTEIN: anaphase-promoting complex subunit 1-like n=1 Tax=Paramacrobiotus metropolitanus TaxID=2943436 RepID=UPI002445826C|nr:LOW QUALITY PROTEIN: anaphase-promoting complex subunit 1-like [Paramacrobiotus metropolitanus]